MRLRAEYVAKAKLISLWAKFGAACDYIPLASLAECQQRFAEFDAIEM
jgi:hypothetical protein